MGEIELRFLVLPGLRRSGCAGFPIATVRAVRGATFVSNQLHEALALPTVIVIRHARTEFSIS
jgi:hypothetical protein